jgi:hypothetical protein
VGGGPGGIIVHSYVGRVARRGSNLGNPKRFVVLAVWVFRLVAFFGGLGFGVLLLTRFLVIQLTWRILSSLITNNRSNI